MSSPDDVTVAPSPRSDERRVPYAVASLIGGGVFPGCDERRVPYAVASLIADGVGGAHWRNDADTTERLEDGGARRRRAGDGERGGMQR
jgi:hypothetical protein